MGFECCILFKWDLVPVAFLPFNSSQKHQKYGRERAAFPRYKSLLF